MNSLRFRLILGFSLVAIVPLAVAMVLLSQRIQSTVREQAADRLAATLGVLGSELRADGEHTLEKLEILARDPTLKRLYLVQPSGSRDLSDYLAEKRVLLSLDFLVVADTSGNVTADASPAPPLASSGGVDSAGMTHAENTSRVGVERVVGAPALALSASAPIPYQSRIVGILRGGILLDRSFLLRLKHTSGVDLELHDPAGSIVASTLEDTSEAATTSPSRRSKERSHLTRTIALESGSEPHASITGLVSTAAADQTIATMRATSALLGLFAIAIAIALGAFWSLQVSRPVERLARFSQRIAQGDWDEPLVLRSVRELETLVSALDRMRHDLRAYRERLVASERHQAWSLMARKVAHEVRNPLTPIAVSIADLKRSYDQKREDFPEILDLAVKAIGEEVETLKRMLHEFSEFGRFPDPRFAPCRMSDLLEDLEALYGHEITEGRLSLPRGSDDVSFSADRAQLRQALVNLIKNGLEAAGAAGCVTVGTGVEPATVEISVADTGPGLSAEQRSNLFLPNFTTKSHGSGLGLTIVERIVNDHGGAIGVESGPVRGTIFRIRLPIAREA